MNMKIHDHNSKGFNGRLEEEVLPRRAVLRNALAVGCGMFLPAAILIGCDSKKSESSTRAAPADSPNTGADSTAPADSPKTSPDAGADTRAAPAAPVAPQKLAQASVQYQTHPKGVQQCDGCAYFVAESNTCTLVEGQVSPEAWCILWVQPA